MKALIACLSAMTLTTPAALTAAPAHHAPAAVTPKPVTPPAPPAPPPAPLPVFEFMGQTTDANRTMSELQGSYCTAKGPKTTCANYSYPKVAGRPMRFLDLEFFNEKLYMVLATFGEQAYQAVADAFTAKYGRPAKVEVRKWQSKGGAVFDNTVMIWKFRDGGTLELESLGNEIGAGRYTFTSSTNSPPAEAPKVDF